jgi:CubicO group peptidase (beta-lactamase class C family)
MTTIRFATGASRLAILPAMSDRALPPLPSQPDGTPWPTVEWPVAELRGRAGVDEIAIGAEVARLFGPHAHARSGETHALLVVHRGEIVMEHYDEERDADTTLISWSMAKSITHALVGTLVRDGALDIHAPAPVPAWSGDGDPRGAITTENLLRMVDGLDFIEDYVDEGASNVIDMLFGSGKADVAGYAEALQLAHPPGAFWSYSSGTSNIVAGIVGRIVGGGRDGMEAFMRRELFGPIGMESATARFDDAGTFIGSSFVFATARDFARFGLLYLRNGQWDDKALLPTGWVDHARTPTPASQDQYGAHFWLATNGSGIFHCSGYRGQYIAIDPLRDLVLVRLGTSKPEQRGAVYRSLDRIDRAFPKLGS